MEKTANTNFFKRKYKVKEAFKRFMRDVYYISKRRELNLAEKQSIKTYLRSIKLLREAGVIDIARCAISFGRNLKDKPLEIWEAIPVVVGRRVTRPNPVDLEYAEILLAYVVELQKYKRNMKDFVLKTVLTGRYSPVAPYFEAHLERVIEETQDRIIKYKTELGGGG